jgi:hypothetical protein
MPPRCKRTRNDKATSNTPVDTKQTKLSFGVTKHGSESIKKAPLLASHSSPGSKDGNDQYHVSAQSVLSNSENTNNNRSQPTERELDLLKCFDMNPVYGPFLGMRRVDRVIRAQKLDLSPPKEIIDILERYHGLSKVDLPSEMWGVSHSH